VQQSWKLQNVEALINAIFLDFDAFLAKGLDLRLQGLGLHGVEGIKAVEFQDFLGDVHRQSGRGKGFLGRAKGAREGSCKAGPVSPGLFCEAKKAVPCLAGHLFAGLL